MTTSVRDQLRLDTCRLLKYDINALTAAQEVRLERAVVLRLEIDDLATKKLNNQTFDIKAYVAASEALERLFGGERDSPTPPVHDFEGAFERLSGYLSDRHEHLEARELSVSEQLRAEIATLQDRLAGKNAVITSLTGSPEPSEQTTSPPPPTQTSNQPPLPLPNAGIPRSYLARHDEPWRPFVDENGIHTPRSRW